jgi:Xaa-Pro aminopeptidase
LSISKAEFSRRRRRLMGLMEEGSIAILPAASRQWRSPGNAWPFRQDSDFHYLCGVNEPDAVLVLIPGRRQGQSVLFCQERDPEQERWDGARPGPEELVQLSGVDDAFPVTDIDDILPGLIEGRQRIYYAMGRSDNFDRRIMQWVNRIRAMGPAGAVPPGEFSDLSHLLHELRLYKSAAEVRLLRHAAAISARAHGQAMRRCAPGLFEYQLEAELSHAFAWEGARHSAYPAIVAGGANACTLHYSSNDQRLRDGDLVLVDAGCEYEGYASDVTRTYPVGGCFSALQRALYDVVLAAQRAAIDAAQPGAHWNAPHDASVRVITEGLISLGLLRGRPATLIRKGAYREFYMHRVGHWLGLDVHDVGDYRVGGQWRLLEPGMVFTIEPGVYIAPDNTRVQARWRGLGVRVEDDVLLTADGPEVLSRGAPVDPEAIEACMAS